MSPNVVKDEWTAKEEKILFDLHKTHGNKWSVIAAELKGRTDNSTKNHFYSIVRKNLRRYNKTQPEKKKINGNIQDLLLDPVVSKILLKRPRHYNRKKNDSKKKSSRKMDKSDPVNTSNFELIQTAVAKAKKTNMKATINIRRNSTDSLKPLNPLASIPASRRESVKYEDLTLDSHYLMPSPIHFDPQSVSLSLLDIISPKNLHDQIGTSPNQLSMSSCRTNNRAFSFKSSEGSFFSRKSSRNNTNESTYGRSSSRKNSLSSNAGKGGAYGDDRRTNFEDNEEVLPTYNLMDSFQYNRSPRR